jgi:hypothetical protein
MQTYDMQHVKMPVGNTMFVVMVRCGNVFSKHLPAVVLPFLK